jgi:hypothetical protein
MLRAHRPLLLNYFKAKKEFSSGVVEGLNNKAKLTMRKSYGASAPSAFWNSPSITHLPSYPSRSLPMNSSDESKKVANDSVDQRCRHDAARPSHLPS